MSTNANSARINAVLIAGTKTLLVGLVICVVAVVCNWSRGFRIPGAIVAGMGAAVVFAGCRGMCLILLTLGKAQDRPWNAVSGDIVSARSASVCSSNEKDIERGDKGMLGRKMWMKQYKGRWLLSKVFLEKERKVEAGFVKEGQMVVLWQALWLWGLVSLGLCLIFLPIGVRA